MGNTIYLDYNATAPIRAEVLDLMGQVLRTPHNASSVHSYGRAGRRIIDVARRQIATMVHADSNNVIFNSGATEGNNTVLKHFSTSPVVISAIEHPSILEVRPDAIRAPVNENGVIDLEALERCVAVEKPALVSVMFVNNETGVIQPVSEISQIARRYGAYFHCDGVQAAGRLPINMLEHGIDFLTLSAHKMGGPQGVGALVLGLCGETPTLLDGGGQEKKARAGTENIAGIAGFGLAAELATAEILTYHQHTVDLQAILEHGLRAFAPDAHIFGENTPRVTNTTLFSIPDIRAESLLMALDLEGICASNGSACSSGSVRSSHVLEAMHAHDSLKYGALRISTGAGSTRDHTLSFLNLFEKILKRIRT